MDQSNNRTYYRERAKASRNLAERAASPMIAGIHLKLATSYDEVVAALDRNGQPRPSDQA